MTAESAKDCESNTGNYTKEYYDQYREGSFRSAMVILPIVQEYLKVSSVVDVGCGGGEWLRAAGLLGIDFCRGVDPNVEATEMIYKLDATKEASLAVSIGRFKLAVCVEVAEHIDACHADFLVEQLCGLAPAVLFGAAIPGQGGEHHVNEQWPQYWVEKFKARGYIAIDCIRRRVWNDENVDPWYAQNTILFVHAEGCLGLMTPKLAKRLRQSAEGDEILPLVHPRKWASLHNWISEVAGGGNQAAKRLPHIFLGIPNAGSCEAMMPNTITRACSAKVACSLQTHASSALTHNFNHLWCEALNNRAERGLTHFAMLHSDVRCLQNNWPDLLLEILEREDCDILSVIMPIKDGRGLTSVALDTDRWRPRRITMHEVLLNGLPPTFGSEDVIRNPAMCRYAVGPVLFNTGLWICRLDRPWAEQVLFDIENKIRKTREGKFVAEFEPEDWKFARWCHKEGIKYKVTREVTAEHVGMSAFPNTYAWGSQEVDEGNIPNVKSQNEGREQAATAA